MSAFPNNSLYLSSSAPVTCNNLESDVSFVRVFSCSCFISSTLLNPDSLSALSCVSSILTRDSICVRLWVYCISCLSSRATDSKSWAIWVVFCQRMFDMLSQYLRRNCSYYYSQKFLTCICLMLQQLHYRSCLCDQRSFVWISYFTYDLCSYTYSCRDFCFRAFIYVQLAYNLFFEYELSARIFITFWLNYFFYFRRPYNQTRCYDIMAKSLLFY